MRRVALALAAAFTTAGTDAGPAHGSKEATAHPQIVLKVASVESPRSPLGVQLEAFRRHVEEATEGLVRVKLLLGGALGDEAKLVARTRQGQVQAFAGSLTALAQAVPAVEVLGSPYLYRDTREAERALERSVRPALERLLPQAGLHFAAWGPSAFRAWFTRGRDLRRPADARGVRVPSARSAAEAATYAALGMVQVPLAASQRVPDAFREGLIDAFDATLLDAAAASHDLSATRVVLSRHALAAQVVVYSELWFAGLPERIQRDLAAAPANLARGASLARRKMDEHLVTHLRARGVSVLDPTPSERAAFVRVTRGARRELARGTGALSLLGATGRR